MGKKHVEQKIKLPVLLLIALLWCLIVATAFTIQADDLLEEIITPGVVYREYVQTEGPWAIQLLDVLKNHNSVSLGVALGGEYVMGIEPLDSLAERVSTSERNVIAGINGDFYILKSGPFQGDPVGFCVVDGELISSPINRSAVVIYEDGTHVIDCFRFNGHVVRPDGQAFNIDGVNQQCSDNSIVLLTHRFNETTRPQDNSVVILAGQLNEPLGVQESYTFTVFEMKAGDSEIAIPPHIVLLMGRGEGADFLNELSPGDSVSCSLGVEPSTGIILHAVGGGPRLMREGDISVEFQEEGMSTAFAETRHPRTAFGFNEEHFYLVTVDGRQEGYSAGMSLTELASFMKKCGAKEAVNLDGGGSTTMLVQGRIRNKPSGKRVRPIANALLLYTSSETKVNYQNVPSLPETMILHGNFPNPFNTATTIKFTLFAEDFVSLNIYSIASQKIRELVSNKLSKGVHSVIWDVMDDNGAVVSSGIYLSQLRMGKSVVQRKMLLLK